MFMPFFNLIRAIRVVDNTFDASEAFDAPNFSREVIYRSKTLDGLSSGVVQDESRHPVNCQAHFCSVRVQIKAFLLPDQELLDA